MNLTIKTFTLCDNSRGGETDFEVVLVKDDDGVHYIVKGNHHEGSYVVSGYYDGKNLTNPYYEGEENEVWYSQYIYHMNKLCSELLRE